MSEQEFLSFETNKFLKEGIKKFPEEFSSSAQTEPIEINKQLLYIGKELFGTFEIITSDGTPVFQVDDIFKAKFIVYASRLPKTQIKIPLKKNEIKTTVENYDKYLDSILKRIQSDVKESLPQSKNILEISNNIFRKLNLTRI